MLDTQLIFYSNEQVISRTDPVGNIRRTSKKSIERCERRKVVVVG